MTKLAFHIDADIYGLILSHKDWPLKQSDPTGSARISGKAGPTWACHHLHIPPPTLIPLPLNSKQIPTTQGGAPITSYKRQQTHPCTPDSEWGGIACSSEIQQYIYVCKHFSTEPESSIWLQSFTSKQAYGWLAANKVFIFFKQHFTLGSGASM